MRAYHKSDAWNHRGVNHEMPIGVVLVVAVTLVLGTVLVTDGVAKQKPSDTPKNERPRYVDELPPMHFLSGDLDRGQRGQWELNDIPLVFTKGSLLIVENEPEATASLVEGQRALVMGHWLGKSFVVRLATLKQRSPMGSLSEEALGPIKSLDPKADPDRTPH